MAVQVTPPLTPPQSREDISCLAFAYSFLTVMSEEHVLCTQWANLKTILKCVQDTIVNKSKKVHPSTHQRRVIFSRFRYLVFWHRWFKLTKQGTTASTCAHSLILVNYVYAIRFFLLLKMWIGKKSNINKLQLICLYYTAAWNIQLPRYMNLCDN